MFIKNSIYEILTPSGFQDFRGVQKLHKRCLLFKCEYDVNVDVSTGHTFYIDGNEVLSDDLVVGDYLDSREHGKVKILDIIHGDHKDVYDLIDVSDGNIYYGGGIVHHNCKFLGSANTVIDEATLKRLLDQPEPVPIMSQKGNFRQYKKPEQGATYLIGVDCAKGTGEHFSTMQVFKLISMNPIKLEQVAVFEDNFMDTYDFSALVDRTAKYYNDAYLMVENNGEGAAVISELWWTHENEGLVCSGTKINNLGIRATSKTKPQAVILMKKLVEDGSIDIVDVPTINQLLTFIEKGNNKFTGNGKPDDLVSALYWMPWIFKMDILEDSMEFKKTKDEDDDNYYGEIFADGDPVEEGYVILQR